MPSPSGKGIFRGGAALAQWIAQADRQLSGSGVSDARRVAVIQRLQQLHDLVPAMAQAASTDTEAPYWVAGDYLRATAVAMLDWAWARIETAPNTDGALSAASQALQHWVLPEFDHRLALVRGALERATTI